MFVPTFWNQNGVRIKEYISFAINYIHHDSPLLFLPEASESKCYRKLLHNISNGEIYENY